VSQHPYSEVKFADASAVEMIGRRKNEYILGLPMSNQQKRLVVELILTTYRVKQALHELDSLGLRTFD
jgi:hypothetical protein